MQPYWFWNVGIGPGCSGCVDEIHFISASSLWNQMVGSCNIIITNEMNNERITSKFIFSQVYQHWTENILSFTRKTFWLVIFKDHSNFPQMTKSSSLDISGNILDHFPKIVVESTFPLLFLGRFPLPLIHWVVMEIYFMECNGIFRCTQRSPWYYTVVGFFIKISNVCLENWPSNRLASYSWV